MPGKSFRASGIVVCALSATLSCSGPNSPDSPPPASAPVVRSIAVPTSRVEAGSDVAITAIVEDTDTPLTALAFQWSASAGTITGTGPTATWRIPAGMKAGLDVTVTLTVTDAYDIPQRNVFEKRHYVVNSTSAPFRVHDSVAETKELARKFLVDLFGNSSIAPASCLVDFAKSCESGRRSELSDIEFHRSATVLTEARVLNQYTLFSGLAAGEVHSAMVYSGHVPGKTLITSTCADFRIVVIYAGNRWWICESTWNPNDRSFCPSSVNDNSELGRIFRQTLKDGGR